MIGSQPIREVIVKTKRGYYVRSKRGKSLGGPYGSRAQAAKRLGQIEFFKRSKHEQREDPHSPIQKTWIENLWMENPA